MDDEKVKAYAYLKAEAEKCGKTFQEFLDTDVRALLEKTWEIQKRTGKPVSIEDLCRDLSDPVQRARKEAKSR